MTIIDDHIVKAAKEWQCAVCKSPIFKTQRHRRVIWKDADERREHGESLAFHCDHIHLRCYL